MLGQVVVDEFVQVFVVAELGLARVLDEPFALAVGLCERSRHRVLHLRPNRLRLAVICPRGDGVDVCRLRSDTVESDALVGLAIDQGL